MHKLNAVARRKRQTIRAFLQRARLSAGLQMGLAGASSWLTKENLLLLLVRLHVVARWRHQVRLLW